MLPTVSSPSRPAHARHRARDRSIAVCVPTVDEAATIGSICAELRSLQRAGAIDRIVVMDESTDGTAEIAAAAGAEVVRQSSVLSEFGSLLGKGDAMWRALEVCDEDIIVFVDGDTTDFSASTASALAGAVLGGASFVKATYRRPFDNGIAVLPTGGGRVTELTAKPLLAAFLPELAAFSQPLAGEIAADAALLRRLPFATGYSVDVALLIDAWREVGIAGLAEVDTGVRQNRHRPLDQLGPMAQEVAAAILDRAGVSAPGRARFVERPPMESVGDRALRVA